jgi:hypothetical protein
MRSPRPSRTAPTSPVSPYASLARLLFSLCITLFSVAQHGNASMMFKVGSKRRRSRAQIEQERKQTANRKALETQKDRRIQELMGRVEEQEGLL